MCRIIKPSYIRCREGNACDILFFGESPGDEEARKGEAFVGPAGRLLREVIDYEMPLSAVVLDNTVPEYLNGDKPDKKKIAEYQSYREASIVTHKPAVVVLLGEIAYKGAGLKGYKPMKDCGRVVQAGSASCVLSVHPSYVLRSRMTQLHLLQRAMQSVHFFLEKPAVKAFECISVRRKLAAWLKSRAGKLCSMDLETSTLSPVDGHILTCAIGCGKQTIWIPLHHPESVADAYPLLNLLSAWWPKGPRVVHNAMMELAWMRSLGAKDPAVLHDTMLQAWLIDENKPKGLDYLVTSVLEQSSYWSDLNLTQLNKEPIERVGTYNAHDAEATLKLYLIQSRQLTPAMKKLCGQILVPFSGVLLRIQDRGIKIDRDKLRELKHKMSRRANQKENQFKKLVNAPDLNVRSPKQLASLLYDQMGLKPAGWTDKGQPATGQEELDKLSVVEPKLRILAEVKQLRSLLSGALRQWDEMADGDDILHTRYNIAFTVTGRLSSSGPNLQNIDRRDPDLEWKGCQRDAIISRFPKGKIVQLDYKQNQLRIHMNRIGQTNFLKRIEAGEDPHNVTMEEINRRSGRQVVTRSIAKNCNFGIIFGGTPYTLYENYGVPLNVGHKVVPQFHETYPRVEAEWRRIQAEMKAKGYVESIFGWRRRLDDPEDRRQRDQAYNFGTQNEEAVIMALAAIEIDEWLSRSGNKSLLIHIIHDSFVLDCPEKESTHVPARVAEIMVNQKDRLKKFTVIRQRTIPLAVDVSVGEHL